MREQLSVTEAAKLLGITRRAVLFRINKKQLPAVLVGRTYIIERRHVRS